MNIAQLIEILSTLPPNLKVQIAHADVGEGGDVENDLDVVLANTSTVLLAASIQTCTLEANC